MRHVIDRTDLAPDHPLRDLAIAGISAPDDRRITAQRNRIFHTLAGLQFAATVSWHETAEEFFVSFYDETFQGDVTIPLIALEQTSDGGLIEFFTLPEDVYPR